MIDLTKTAGAGFMGFLLSTAFLGVTFIQYSIFCLQRDDNLWLKLYVFLLVFLDTTSSILIWHIIFHQYIQKFGATVSAENLPLTWPTEYAVTSVVAFLSQMYYAQQIFRLNSLTTRRRIPVVLVMCFSVISLIANISVVPLIVTFVTKSSSITGLAVAQRLSIPQFIANSFGAASDIGAAAILCIFFAGNFAGLERHGRQLVVRLLSWTINRGLVFCMMQIAMTITFYASPLTGNWLLPHYCLSKVHVNTLLAQLNSRPYFLARDSTEIHIDSREVRVQGTITPSRPTAVQQRLEMGFAKHPRLPIFEFEYRRNKCPIHLNSQMRDLLVELPDDDTSHNPNYLPSVSCTSKHVGIEESGYVKSQVYIKRSGLPRRSRSFDSFLPRHAA